MRNIEETLSKMRLFVDYLSSHVFHIMFYNVQTRIDVKL